MKAFISHNTALVYWRQHFPLDSELSRPARVSKAEEVAHRKADVFECVPETFRIPDEPIDILLFDADDRRWSQQVSCCVWGTTIPAGAFYRVGNMYVSSPEFVFLQMAPRLTVRQLVALGCELCGTYVLLPESNVHPMDADSCPKRVAPLTNISKMVAFVKKATKARGRSKALRVLNYVIEGSRSPMETMTYMLMCLPPKLGGYGIPKPVMNAEIELDSEARAIARRETSYGDLCWPDDKLDLEYHGEVHVGSSQMKSDVGRELGIEHMKWHVITVTSPQVLDMDLFETVVKQVAARLNKRLYPSCMGPIEERLTLREELERWTFAKQA